MLKLSWYVQYEPIEGAEPSQKTNFKIVYDNNNLYLAIKCFDSEIDKIDKRLLRRDSWEGDIVGVEFDSYFDKKTALLCDPSPVVWNVSDKCKHLIDRLFHHESDFYFDHFMIFPLKKLTFVSEILSFKLNGPFRLLPLRERDTWDTNFFVSTVYRCCPIRLIDTAKGGSTELPKIASRNLRITLDSVQGQYMAYIPHFFSI